MIRQQVIAWAEKKGFTRKGNAWIYAGATGAGRFTYERLKECYCYFITNSNKKSPCGNRGH